MHCTSETVVQCRTRHSSELFLTCSALFDYPSSYRTVEQTLYNTELDMDPFFFTQPSSGSKGARLALGGKSPNKELICLLVPVTLYSTLCFKKEHFYTTVTGSNKQCLLINTTHTVV